MSNDCDCPPNNGPTKRDHKVPERNAGCELGSVLIYCFIILF